MLPKVQSCQCGNTVRDQRYDQLDKVIAQYRNEPGPLIPVLHKAQKIFGYLPREVQLYVADKLDIPVKEVAGVVSFYSFFSTTPRGEHTIGLCMGTACYVKGADAISAKIKEELGIKPGETTGDGKFTFQITRCLGACGLAPVMTIDDDVFGRLTPEKIPEILKKYSDQ